MQGNKENQEISVVGRLFSLEALILLMGVVSLIYGLITGQMTNIIIGALVLAVTLLLARAWRRSRLK
jgi:hypothetical protein